MSLAYPLRNYTDIDGNPVCPTCGRPIKPAQAVMRIDDCMIHVSCASVARTVPEPCEPTP